MLQTDPMKEFVKLFPLKMSTTCSYKIGPTKVCNTSVSEKKIIAFFGHWCPTVLSAWLADQLNNNAGNASN